MFHSLCLVIVSGMDVALCTSEKVKNTFMPKIPKIELGRE